MAICACIEKRVCKTKKTFVQIIFMKLTVQISHQKSDIFNSNSYISNKTRSLKVDIKYILNKTLDQKFGMYTV
jgi:hypothetical protein